MDERIVEITNWYNTTRKTHDNNWDEFKKRFVNSDGKLFLNNTDMAKGFGELKREAEILNAIGSILLTDTRIFNVPDDISGLD